MEDGLPGNVDPSLADPAVGQPAGLLLTRDFTAETVTAVRHDLVACAAAAGLSGDDRDDFVLAVHELVTNAVRHGGGSGRVQLRRVDDDLVCEVIDNGPGTDGLPVHLPAANVPGGRGLWLAHQLTGALMLSRRPDGVTAAVSVCLAPNPSVTHTPVVGAGETLDRRTAKDEQS